MWTKTCSIEHCDKRGPRKLKVSLQISWCKYLEWHSLFLGKLVLTLPLVLCLHTCHRPHFGKDQPVDFDGITTTWQDVQQVSMHQKAMHKSLQDIYGSPLCPSTCFSWGKDCLPRPSSSPKCQSSSARLASSLLHRLWQKALEINGGSWSTAWKLVPYWRRNPNTAGNGTRICKKMDGWKQA